jgi:hypothetical protein
MRELVRRSEVILGAVSMLDEEPPVPSEARTGCLLPWASGKAAS